MSNTERVFFPGCSLSSYNPVAVQKTLLHLQERMPGTGALLTCCGKPTKALGQADKFNKRYAGVTKQIESLGAKEVIVACQSCYLTFNECSPDLNTRSLWTILPEIGLPDEAVGIGKDSDLRFAIHDSCSTRHEYEIHEGIRWIMDELGYSYEEPPHTKKESMCCGFGGMVLLANPDLSKRIMSNRTAEVKSDHMVTYCAACRMSMIMGGKQSLHILDLIFGGPWNSDSVFPGAGSTIDAWKNRRKAKKAIERALA